MPLLAVVTPGALRRSGNGALIERSPPGVPFAVLRFFLLRLSAVISRSGFCRWPPRDAPFAGPDGTGIPDITDTHIHFNGVRHGGHAKVDGPMVVTAALLFPSKVNYAVSSDRKTETNGSLRVQALLEGIVAL